MIKRSKSVDGGSVHIIPWNSSNRQRHRSRCVYYLGGEEKHCSYVHGRCRGANCPYYKENVLNKQIVAKSILDREPYYAQKTIPMSDIELNRYIRQSISNAEIQSSINYYKINKKFKDTIIVGCQGSKYFVRKNAVNFLAAKELNHSEIEAIVIASEQAIATCAKSFKAGSLIWDKQNNDAGIVMTSNKKNIIVKLDSGDVITYDTSDVFLNEQIRIL